MTSAPCLVDCRSFVEFGPPPDSIVRLPPPPVPAFLQNSADVLVSINGSCDFCNWARGLDIPYIEVARQPSDDTLYLAAISACIGILVVSILLVVAVLRCRENKIKLSPDSMSYVPPVADGHTTIGDRRQPKMLWSGLGKEDTASPYTLQHQPVSQEESFAHYEYIDYGSVGHNYAYPGEIVRIVNKENHYHHPDSLDASFENSAFVDSENHATSL